MAVPITAGSGTNIATDVVAATNYQQVKLVDGTIGSVTPAIVDSFGNLRVAGGQSSLPTFSLFQSNQANTAATEALVIESYAAAIVRLQRIIIWNPGIQTSGGIRVLQLLRTTTAGTGGVVVPAQFGTDAAAAGVDAAYSGICRAKPTAGTETTVLMEIPIFVPTALAAFVPMVIDFSQIDAMKAPAIPAGAANGMALKDPGAAGGASFSAEMIFTVGA